MSDGGRTSPADWRLLGLAPGATPEEILRAYDHRRALYHEEALASYSLMLEEERRQHLERLTAARDRLLAAVTAARSADHGPTPSDAAEPDADLGPAPDREHHPGDWLRHRRRSRGMTLDQLSKETRIRVAVIEQLEGERYDQLSAPVFVRGFVIQIARALAVPDPEAVAALYLRRVERSR